MIVKVKVIHVQELSNIVIIIKEIQIMCNSVIVLFLVEDFLTLIIALHSNFNIIHKTIIRKIKS